MGTTIKYRCNVSLKSVVMGLVLAIASFFMMVGGAEVSFKDVPESHWGYEAVNYSSAKGIIKGYPDGTFRPAATLNEGHFVKMVVIQMYPSEYGDYIKKYGEEQKTYEYYPYYKLLADKGYKMAGLDNSRVAYSLISRINTAKLIYFAMNDKHAATNQEAIEFLIDKGITTENVGNFRENQSLQRIQGAAFIYRIHQAMSDNGGTKPPAEQVPPPASVKDITLHKGYGINIEDPENLTIYKNDTKVGEVTFTEGTEVNGLAVGQSVTANSFSCKLEGNYYYDLTKNKSGFERALCNDGTNTYYYYINRLDDSTIEYIITLKNENKDFMNFVDDLSTISKGELNQLMIYLINTTRSDNNTLSYDAELAQIAQYHTDNMIKYKFFSHTDQDGKSPDDRSYDFNYEHGSIGENLTSIGNNLFESHLSLINSAIHYQIMTDLSLTNAGIGIGISSPSNTLLVTQNFSIDNSHNTLPLPFPFDGGAPMQPE